jgi:hypothetical protein
MTGALADHRRIADSDFDAVARRAESAIVEAEATRCLARGLAQQSRELRVANAAAQWPRFFVVHGWVEGERVRASWFRGSLKASSALRTRADLLVRMGETFCVPRRDGVLEAGLDEPLAAMLTFVRSCDRLDAASFGPLIGNTVEFTAS